MKLDNSNLSAVVNEYPEDPIELRAFDKIFTCQNIWKWWCKVGFIPMSWNELYDDKVRLQMGGETAAMCDKNKNLNFLSVNFFKLQMR